MEEYDHEEIIGSQAATDSVADDDEKDPDYVEKNDMIAVDEDNDEQERETQDADVSDVQDEDKRISRNNRGKQVVLSPYCAAGTLSKTGMPEHHHCQVAVRQPTWRR